MPELPEVETVVRELRTKLVGLTIDDVLVRTPKMVALGAATVSNVRRVSRNQVEEFRQRLIGQTVLAVKRRAKLLWFDLSGPDTILVHLKMTGQFIFESPAERQKTGGLYRVLNRAHAPQISMPSKHTHIIFQFTNGSQLFFNDQRLFGYMKVLRDDELASLRELREYGPEPLSRDFTAEYFLSAIRRRSKSPIKTALLDPKIVVGIGNIYSDEILFRAKILPQRPVATLSDKEFKAVYEAIVPILKLGIKHKGSSVGEFIRTDGSFGSTAKHHFVYGLSGKPCQICRHTLTKIKLGGRTSSYCPHCQK